MPVTDPTADMLTVLRNGSMARKETVEVKRSSLHENILEILKNEGFISNYKPMDDKRQGLIKIYLKYCKDQTPAITGLKTISKPGRRVYTKSKDVKSVYGGLGIAIISTSEGLMTEKDAREKNVGGEIICQAW